MSSRGGPVRLSEDFASSITVTLNIPLASWIFVRSYSPAARANWRLVIKPERLRDVRFANIIVVAERGCV